MFQNVSQWEDNVLEFIYPSEFFGFCSEKENFSSLSQNLLTPAPGQLCSDLAVFLFLFCHVLFRRETKTLVSDRSQTPATRSANSLLAELGEGPARPWFLIDNVHPTGTERCKPSGPRKTMSFQFSSYRTYFYMAIRGMLFAN